MHKLVKLLVISISIYLISLSGISLYGTWLVNNNQEHMDKFFDNSLLEGNRLMILRDLQYTFESGDDELTSELLEIMLDGQQHIVESYLTEDRLPKNIKLKLKERLSYDPSKPNKKLNKDKKQLAFAPSSLF